MFVGFAMVFTWTWISSHRSQQKLGTKLMINVSELQTCKPCHSLSKHAHN